MDRPKSLTYEEKCELAITLMNRKNAAADATPSVQACFPSSPPSMIHTAVFHMYVDGAHALVDVLADAELAIRQPGRGFDHGHLSHAIYHMYNLLQFMTVLPLGSSRLLGIEQDLKKAVEAKDLQWVEGAVDELQAALHGEWEPPSVP